MTGGRHILLAVAGEPDVLYHYTDAGAFAAIAEHRNLRATDIRFLNDPLELRYGWRKLLRALEAAKTSKPEYSEAYDAALNAISMVDAVDPVASEERLFSISFSARGDHLGQWRSYADDAKGIALGFAKDSISMLEVPYFHHGLGGELTQMTAIIGGTTQEVPFKWGSFTQPVVYGRKARARAIENVLWEIEQYCLKNGEGLLPSRLYTLINRVPLFLSKLALVKKKTYQSEREWRFTIPEHLSTSSLSMKKALGQIEEFKWAAQGALETVDVKFRPGGRAGLKPYTEIPFKTEALVRVVVGPNVESRDLALSTARQVLDRYGFRDTEVVPSKHAYRV